MAQGRKRRDALRPLFSPDFSQILDFGCPIHRSFIARSEVSTALRSDDYSAISTRGLGVNALTSIANPTDTITPWISSSALYFHPSAAKQTATDHM